MDVILWQDRPFQPDRQYEEKRFLRCFDGPSALTSAHWTGLYNGDHYFEAHRIARGNSCCLLFVNSVYVDTTKGD